MNTSYLSGLLLVCFAPLVPAGQSVSESLTSAWIDGYMYDMRRAVRLVRDQSPMSARCYIAGEAVEFRIDDPEAVAKIVDLTLTDVEASVAKENWIDEDGDLHGKRSYISGYSDTVILTWKEDGATSGISIRENGVTTFTRLELSSRDIHETSTTRSCGRELVALVIQLVQQTASGNADKPRT